MWWLAKTTVCLGPSYLQSWLSTDTWSAFGPKLVPRNFVSPDKLLIDIHYYFEKSSKRRKDLNEFQEFCSVAQRVQTQCLPCWLSLGEGLDHLLHQWLAFQLYFESKSENQKSSHIQKKLKDPKMKMYCHTMFWQIQLDFSKQVTCPLQVGSECRRAPAWPKSLPKAYLKRCIEPKVLNEQNI